MAAVSFIGHGHSACNSLLRELQHIWDEMGEIESERENMLLQLEQECLEVYRCKVEQANKARSKLLQALTDAKTELSSLISSLGVYGDHSSSSVSTEEHSRTLREQLVILQPQLDELRQKKEERVTEFMEVKVQIHKLCAEISGSSESLMDDFSLSGNEQDLSLRRLDQYRSQLEALQAEKNQRLQKILDYVHVLHGLCSVLGMDFHEIVTGIHPSLKSEAHQLKSISNETLEKVVNTIISLQKEKLQNMRKIQDLSASLLELWNLMGTQFEERQLFLHITCLIGASEDEITTPGVLALSNIQKAEAEVARLDKLKASRMKELVMKKQAELEDICRAVHMDSKTINTCQDKIMATIDSGIFDSSEVLASMDRMIARAREEAYGRREILEKMERWLSACEEENWLEDYNKDDNRYNASRGAHINLKRAEKARLTVNKLPALVDSLVAKIKAWEEERGTPFHYDKVHLVSMLEEYKALRQKREEEKRRLRDHKRFQGQFLREQESFSGSRPGTPTKSLSFKKGTPPSLRSNGNSNGNGNNGNGNINMAMRRLSLGATNGSMTTPTRRHSDGIKDTQKIRPVAPQNFVALSKGDASNGNDNNGNNSNNNNSNPINSSFSSSITGSEPVSPMSA